MSSQITHSQTLPKNIDYWDYYILCRCDDSVSKVMQRMEYWDGTKAGGNIHAEQTNDQLISASKEPTQDTSRFVYKTREELTWELIGAVCESSAYKALDRMIYLQYLRSRHNPYKTFDRTLQYEFQCPTIQEHLDRLSAIIKCFIDHGRICRPVLFAIEQLTREEIYINRIEQEDGTLDGKDLLTIALVAERLGLMHQQMHQDEEESKKKPAEGEKKKYKPLLPTFIKSDLKKDEARGFSADFPLCKNIQCIHTFLHNASMQKCTMDCVKTDNPLCKNIRAIPVITTEITNSNYNTERENESGDLVRVTTPISLTQEEIVLILSLRESHHQGSEHAPEIVHAPALQSQPTPVASSHNAPPFENDHTTVGEAHHSQPLVTDPQNSGFLPAPESVSTPSPAQSTNESLATTQATLASSQREIEPVSTNGTEASELRIADTTPSETNETNEIPTSRRKPDAPTMKDRVEAVYNCYEQLCREKFEDENITIKRRGNRTEEYKAIKDALESKDGVTPTSLRQVFLDMWNEKGREGDYFYRDLTHITVRAVCNQHGKRMANIRFREKKSSNKSVSGLPNLTYAGQTPTPSSLPFDEQPYTTLNPAENTDQPRTTRKFKLRRVADIEAEIAARQAAHA